MIRTLLAYVVPVLNFTLLVAVGLDLTVSDFARVSRQRLLVLAGLIAPLVLLPPIAVALTWLMQTPPEITVGLLLVASCPIGGISNLYSYLAKASVALSVTLTALSCLAAGVTIPLAGKFIELLSQQPLGLSAPFLVLIGQLLLALGLPVALGMAVRQRAPHLADRHGPALRRLALIGTALVLLMIVVDAPDAFASELATTIPLAGGFVLCSLAAGWITAVLVTSDGRDRFTVSAEFGTRNLAVAIAIAVTLLGRVEFARFVVAYAIVEIPLLLAAVALFRRRQAVPGVGRPVELV